MRALQEGGLRVPEDVAVVGFDNIEESQYAVPSLSTIDPGRAQIAERAVDLLVRRLGESRDAVLDPERVFVEFDVIVRESS